MLIKLLTILTLVECLPNISCISPLYWNNDNGWNGHNLTNSFHIEGENFIDFRNVENITEFLIFTENNGATFNGFIENYIASLLWTNFSLSIGETNIRIETVNDMVQLHKDGKLLKEQQKFSGVWRIVARTSIPASWIIKYDFYKWSIIPSEPNNPSELVIPPSPFQYIEIYFTLDPNCGIEVATQSANYYVESGETDRTLRIELHKEEDTHINFTRTVNNQSLANGIWRIHYRLKTKEDTFVLVILFSKYIRDYIINGNNIILLMMVAVVILAIVVGVMIYRNPTQSLNQCEENDNETTSNQNLKTKNENKRQNPKIRKQSPQSPKNRHCKIVISAANITDESTNQLLPNSSNKHIPHSPKNTKIN